MKSNRTYIPIPISRSFLTLTAGLSLALFAPVLAVNAQTAYVSTGSGALNNSAIWSPAGVPGSLDTIEVTSGNLVTNTVTQAWVGTVTIDAGGTFALNASMTIGVVTNKGTLNLNASTSGRVLTMNGNLVNNGSITTSSTSGGDQITFTNTSLTSLWLGSGDISTPKCGLTVNAGATLDISGLTTPLKLKSSGTFASSVAGTLITGTQVINGNGNGSCSFASAAGGTLITANPNGIINGASGTLNLAGTVTLSTAANYIFNGTSTQVTLGLPATVNNLTISNSAGVALSAATMISGALALNNGVLTTTTGTTPTAATVTSMNNSYVSGPLALVYGSTGAQTFPVGKGGNERQVTLNYTALTGSSTVTVEQFEAAMGGTVPSGTTQFGSRYWMISQSGGSGVTYGLMVNGTGFTPAATPVLLQQGSPDLSYSTTFAAPNYTATGLTTFGNFTLGNYSPAANQLAFTTSAQTLMAGVTSGTITAQLQNSGSSPLNTTTNLTVSLSTTSGGGVFRDTGDTTTITSITILAGNNSASFKYKDTVAPASPTVTAATTSGVNPATQSETVNVAAANKLAFTSEPGSTNLAATMAPVVVQVQDQYGNPVAQSGAPISLTLNNGGSSMLTGTIPQITSGTGVATFSDLAITGAVGAGLTLTATGGGLTLAVSSSFNIASQIIVKALNNTALNAGTSWTGSLQPDVNDTAQIDNTSVSTTINSPDIGGGVTWYGLNIVGWSSSHGYTVTDTSGGNSITLGAGGLNGTVVTHTIAFNCGLTLTTNEVWNWSGSSGTLTFNSLVDTAAHQLILGGNQPVSVTASGGITGAGSLVKQGTDTLTLGGNQNYTGLTTVSNGTLLVSGTLSGNNAVIVTSGTLTGNGSISSPITVQSGGIFAPGGGLTTLTLSSNLTLQAGSQTQVKVNRDTLASDQANGIYQANYGGTLTVTNVSGTLQLNDSFTIFSAGSYTGNFSSISGSPGAGLAWNFNPTNGVLSIINSTATNSTNLTATVSGSALTLTWPTDHLGWVLQSQTNSLSIGLTTNWVDVAGSGASTTNIIAINPTNPTAFFRLRSP